MIIDLQHFIAGEQPYWKELEQRLGRAEKAGAGRMDLPSVKRFHYLYRRTATDLAKVTTGAAEPLLRQYLETLVARAYAVIHARGEGSRGRRPLDWLLVRVPLTFRRHAAFFVLSAAIMAAGSVFGALAVALDPEAREVLMPFSHLQQDPSQRVAGEESESAGDRRTAGKSVFSSYLMTHNIRISILALALGMTWGIGTVLLLFSNGVMLGAVILDYIRAGETLFLAGWLLPHGAVEIPAILIAGQGGLLLAAALIGRGRPAPVGDRLRAVSGDLITLIGATALLLVWAGIVEAFFSQYHEPMIPYEIKIAVGVLELGILPFMLLRSGRRRLEPGNRIKDA